MVNWIHDKYSAGLGEGFWFWIKGTEMACPIPSSSFLPSVQMQCLHYNSHSVTMRPKANYVENGWMICYKSKM